MIDYEDLAPGPIDLPAREKSGGRVRLPLTDRIFVPEHY